MLNKTENIFKFAGLLIICGTVLGGFAILRGTGIYIKDVSNNQLPQNLVTNTISVNGEGKVSVQPDMIIVDINIHEEKKTTEQAQESVNLKLKEIQAILDENKIPKSDVQTSNISVRPEYDWVLGRNQFKFYVAEHTLKVKIKKADKDNDGKGAKIIDLLSKVGGIQIYNISYDIEDKTAFYTEARKLAMSKAKQKAEEMAKIAGVKLLKPMAITESDPYTYNPPYPMMANSAMKVMESSDAGGGSISLGQMELTLNVSVVYSIE